MIIFIRYYHDNVKNLPHLITNVKFGMEQLGSYGGLHV